MDFEQEERQDRGYLYWTPNRWITVSAEYQREEFTSSATSPVFETQRVPLGINMYHPSGLTGRIKASYIDQEGTFSGTSGPVDDEDQFWIVDAAISYRLPKRYGLITLGGTNLLDKEFNFEEQDSVGKIIYPQLLVYPKRLLYTRFTLLF